MPVIYERYCIFIVSTIFRSFYLLIYCFPIFNSACYFLTRTYTFTFTGHGGRVKDKTGREESGFNSTLVPVDFDSGTTSAGRQIIDDELYEHLVCRMPHGSTLTCLMDCCHSGTVLDLPFNFVADGEQTEMVEMEDFPFLQLLQLVGKALSDAGVEQLRDLRDKDKRQHVMATLLSADNNAIGGGLLLVGEEQRSMENSIEGLRRDFKKGDIGAVRDAVQDNRKARQDRRQNRRKMFR